MFDCLSWHSNPIWEAPNSIKAVVVGYRAHSLSNLNLHFLPSSGYQRHSCYLSWILSLLFPIQCHLLNKISLLIVFIYSKCSIHNFCVLTTMVPGIFFQIRILLFTRTCVDVRVDYQRFGLIHHIGQSCYLLQSCNLAILTVFHLGIEHFELWDLDNFWL